MKLLNFKAAQIVVLALLLGAVLPSAYAQIYKVVDEAGNVSYTDTAPKDGSKPMDIPPVSVVEAPEYQVRAKPVEGEGDQPTSLRALRSQYRDFAITSPTTEDSVWAPEQAITVSWSTRKPLLPGMMVKVSIDGKFQNPTTSNVISMPPLDRGEHQAGATLVDSEGQVVAEAEAVTFYVRQPNLYSNPQRVRPRG
jgi:hypothetical protein